MGLGMAKRKRGFFGWIWYVVWRLALLIVVLLLILRFLPPPTTAFMLQSPTPVTYKWVGIQHLPAHVALAVISSEDQRFPDHYGVDFTAIHKALTQHDEGEELRGASTITQQTAKNLFLWPGRSYIRKGLEAGIALGLEALWGKKRILEVYLNIAEFGPGIYGVEAASQHYFGKTAKRLTARQSAQLAVLLPNPKERDPNRLTPYLRERVQWIERQMDQLGPNYLNDILK